MIQELQTLLDNARQDVTEDAAKWEALATGQDSEEAEHSGYLEGYRDGLKAALDLMNVDDEKNPYEPGSDLARIWQLGYDEGDSDVGRTYDDHPESERSHAYDLGRQVRADPQR